MKELVLASIISIGVPVFSYASLNAVLNSENSPKPKSQLIVALQDNNPTTGTDSGTTTFPWGGLNTTPTNNTGTETRVERSTKAPPPDYDNSYGHAPFYKQAPAYAPAPAYTPPPGAAPSGILNR